MRFGFAWRGGQGSLGSFQVLVSCSLRSFRESQLLRQTLCARRPALCSNPKWWHAKKKTSDVFYKTHDHFQQIPKVTKNKKKLRNVNR